MSSRLRHDIAFILDAILLILRQRDLRVLRFAGMLVSVVVLEAACLMICVPTASITSGSGATGISVDGQIHIRVNRFSSINDAVVFVNGEQRLHERGVDGNDFTAQVDARPGSTISVEIKVESAIGLERDMSSTFTTAAPEILP